MSAVKLKKSTGVKKINDKQPNPYLMAFLTALLAGIFSIIGGYFVSKFQAQYDLGQKLTVNRVNSYTEFLNKIHENEALVELLQLGIVWNYSSTDSEIQEYEDRWAYFLERNDIHKVVFRLNNTFNTIRLYASNATIEICDDISLLLLGGADEINWSKYPDKVSSYYFSVKDKLAGSVDGLDYVDYIERKTTDYEHMSLVTTSLLMQELIKQLREEIHASKIT